jgi:hypothetical protein
MTKDEQLQCIALQEWEHFKTLVGEKAIIRASVVMLRRNGLSYGQIEKRLGISREWACRIYLRWHDETVSERETVKRKIS